MTDNIDNLINEFNNELNQYYKGQRQERAARMARRQKEAFKRKYPFANRHKAGKCQVYDKLRTAGFSHVVSDSMCRMVAKYHIDPKLNITQLVNAVKDVTTIKTQNKGAYSFEPRTTTDSNGVGFQDNKTNSTEPGNTGVPDKKFPDSSYGNDYSSCVISLSKITDSNTAIQECATQWLGKGSRGGQSKNASAETEIPYHMQLLMSQSEIEQAERQLKEASKLKSASNKITEVPAWAVTNMSAGELAQAQDAIDAANNQNRLKSASAKQQREHDEYIRSIHETYSEALARRNNERIRKQNYPGEE